MSAKGSKRRQRRVNTTEEDTDKKNEEIIDISDDNKSTISTDTDKMPKDTIKDTKEIEEEAKEDKKENGEKILPRTSPKPSPKTSPKKIDSVENGQSEENIPDKKEENKEEPPKNEEKTNGQENGSSSTPTHTPQEDIEEMEPLIIIDSEEQELQFPSETGSETSEIEKSPILNRCQTRRSHTRNQPTPKTPKSLDFEEEKPKNPITDLRINVTRLQPTPEVAEEEAEKSENVSVISTENESSFSEKTQDTDVTNASVFAIFGDTTRNIDITTNSIMDDSTINTSNVSSFIDLTKDKSYGETLRCLTGRKTVRRNFEAYKPRFYQSNIELTSKDLTDASNNYSPRITATKRKLDQESPGEYKKVKSEGSPGFFAYISSPFKSIVGRTAIPSSTPKLTGFKYSHQGPNPIDEVEKIGVDFVEEKKVEPKKGCEIM